MNCWMWIASIVLACALAGCGGGTEDGNANANGNGNGAAVGGGGEKHGHMHDDDDHAHDDDDHAHDDDDHAHDDDDHAHDDDDHAHDVDHEHDEDELGTTTIDGMEVSGWQGHGPMGPGDLSHLVIKLPYSDAGATTVRAWIGTADRDLYLVGLGEYAASHDDYDIHAEAPDPLPEDARWWIEIEKPDGSVSRGSLPIIRR